MKSTFRCTFNKLRTNLRKNSNKTQQRTISFRTELKSSMFGFINQQQSRSELADRARTPSAESSVKPSGTWINSEMSFYLFSVIKWHIFHENLSLIYNQQISATQNWKRNSLPVLIAFKCLETLKLDVFYHEL